VALIRAIAKLEGLEGETEGETVGVRIVRRALEEPLRQISANAGVEGAVIVEEVRSKKGSYGYNARTEEYGDMIQMGVVDPTKVVRSALENAASIASLLLTTEAMVTDEPEDEADAAPAAGHHHH
jgi:chaperonin GroEL